MLKRILSSAKIAITAKGKLLLLTEQQEAKRNAWFDKYIKPTAPAAGTATFSSTFTGIADYQNNFYIIRVALIGVGADPAAVAALDAWWAKMTVSARYYAPR